MYGLKLQGKYYIGMTENMTTRMKQHASAPPTNLKRHLKQGVAFWDQVQAVAIDWPLFSNFEAQQREKHWIQRVGFYNVLRAAPTIAGKKGWLMIKKNK